MTQPNKSDDLNNYNEIADVAYSVPKVNDNAENKEENLQSYQRGTAAPATTIMDIADLTKRRDAIKNVYENVMVEGKHYGMPFADSDKPTLLKAGGEVLCSTFMLAPKFQKTLRNLGDGHREVEFACYLFHIPTSRFVGEGVGSCSTMESKYRYRWDNRATDVPVPESVWKAKDNKDYGKAKELIKKQLKKAGEKIKTDADVWMTKSDDGWVLSVKQKVENPDIANEYNTVLKIAKKRALNDAVLTATGASEFFTQDLEDVAANEGKPYDRSGNSDSKKSKSKQSGNDNNDGGQRTQRPPSGSQKKDKPKTITDQQLKVIKNYAVVLPEQRRKKLLTAVKENNPSYSWAKKTCTFLQAYDKVKNQFQEFEKHESDLPDVFWDTLEGAEDVKQLMSLIESLQDAVDRVADGKQPFPDEAIDSL